MVVEEFIMFLRFPNKCLDSLALIGGSFSTKWIDGVDEYTIISGSNLNLPHSECLPEVSIRNCVVPIQTKTVEQ